MVVVCPKEGPYIKLKSSFTVMHQLCHLQSSLLLVSEPDLSILFYPLVLEVLWQILVLPMVVDRWASYTWQDEPRGATTGGDTFKLFLFQITFLFAHAYKIKNKKIKTKAQQQANNFLFWLLVWCHPKISSWAPHIMAPSLINFWMRHWDRLKWIIICVILSFK